MPAHRSGPRPHNDPDYRAARAWLTAHPGTLCWRGCGRSATDIDHVPALMHHRHVRGSGCCSLYPACAPCNRGKGAADGNAKRLGPTSETW